MTREEKIDEIMRLQSEQSSAIPRSREDKISQIQSMEASPSEAPVSIPQEPTLEEGLGLNKVYNVADKLKYLDNIRSKSFALTAGPLIDIGKGVDPYENVNKEITSWEPQAKSSFMGRFREAFPEQKPIMDTPFQDIAQGETKLGTAKAWVQKEFPKAYEFASSVVPSDVPGIALDAFMGDIILPHVPQEGVVNTLDEAAQSERGKGLIKNSDLDRSKNIEMVTNKKMEIVGNTLNEYGLADLIHNPEELHKQLAGDYGIEYDKNNIQRGKPGYGIINELTDSVKQGASHISQGMPPIDVNQMANDIINKMSGESRNQNSLVKFAAKDQTDLINQVKGKLKTNIASGLRSFSDLIDMKRNAADAIYEIKSNPETYGVQGVTDLKVHKAIWSEIDNRINGISDTDPNVSNFVKANNDLSNLLNAKDIVAGAKTSNLSGSSAVEALGMAGIGLAAGEAVGHPVLGASIGGGFGAARAVFKDIANQIPSRTASLAQNAADYIRPGKGLSQIALLLRPGAVANVPNIQQQMMMQKGLVENLAEYKIPRNSEAILSNTKLALAKLAQATNDPKLVATLQDALMMHPEQLKNILPIIGTQFPNIFHPDKYNRFDGKIFSIDPIQKQMMIHNAYQDVNNNRALTNTQKAQYQDGLNRDGSLPDDYQ
jgi:hypothetical protein